MASLRVPAIEVHLSNIYAREPYRHNSYLSKHVEGVICGMGLDGYEMALQKLITLQKA